MSMLSSVIATLCILIFGIPPNIFDKSTPVAGGMPYVFGNETGGGGERGSTTIRLRTFRLRYFVYRHFVYRHFVYYCIPGYRTVIHPTSVPANHYCHRFQLLLTL